MKKATVRKFLKGTKNNDEVNLYFGETCVFSGTYADFKANGADFFDEFVLSWDACEYIGGNGEEFTAIDILM